MIEKRKIVLASLLKPVDDPRMYEKFALSMSQTNKYDINIIGFASKKIPDHPDIHFHPIFKFKRLSLKRLISAFKYWQKLLEVKPELIIVNTHDLLIVSCAYKIIFGGKIIYDVQENYKANIIWSSDLPLPLRHLLAWAVRTKEHIAKRMIIHFFLAEKCYLNECSFIERSFTFLENKALRPSVVQYEREKPARLLNLSGSERTIRFIYSGTIAESYGIFDCLHLIERWASGGADVLLTIIGYCPRMDTLDVLRQKIKDKPYIQLIGGEELVDHQSILQELQKAHFSLISYNLNPSNKDCMPTRIWECLAYKIPMIMKKEHPWTSLLNKYGAGIAMDYHTPPPFEQLRASTESFYLSPLPEDIYWEYEEKKLLKSLETVF